MTKQTTRSWYHFSTNNFNLQEKSTSKTTIIVFDVLLWFFDCCYFSKNVWGHYLKFDSINEALVAELVLKSFPIWFFIPLSKEVNCTFSKSKKVKLKFIDRWLSMQHTCFYNTCYVKNWSFSFGISVRGRNKIISCSFPLHCPLQSSRIFAGDVFGRFTFWKEKTSRSFFHLQRR